MNKKILSKVIATSLAVILTLTNFIILGIYQNVSYATSNTLENQNPVSNNENVKFDAYFMEGENKKTHSTKQDIDETTNLYLAVNVEKGYLKNAKIEIVDENGKSANFKIVSEEANLKSVEKIDIEKNEIYLKQINTQTQIIQEALIKSSKSEMFDVSNFNKINNVKLTGTYVDNSGKNISIEKTIKIRMEWYKETNLVLEQETKTYIPYEIEKNKGTILQTLVKIGAENNNLPLKNTNITIKVPKINEKNPEAVQVNSSKVELVNNTKLQNTNEINQNQYNYDEKTGILTIITNNELKQNKVTWNKQNKDEYIITYIYKDKVEGIQTSQDTQVKIECYNNIETKLEGKNTLTIQENEVKGNFVKTEITGTTELSKGHLHTITNKEIEYNENIELTIAYANLVDKILVENKVDGFVKSNEENTLSTLNNTYYKTTIIDKENFEKILGTDGYIKILGTDGKEITQITNNTKVNEQGKYEYKYENEINEIKIQTSKPIQEGKLEISNIKALRGKTNYTKQQIQEFQKLQLKVNTNVEYKETKIENIETKKDITLIAPETKIETATNKDSLSTIIKNENVELRVILKTNDISCDLYKNPKVEIVLPNYIKELKIKDVNLLFENELKIKERKTYVNETGNIVIQISLDGEQTKYCENELSKGANIVIHTDITLKKLTPSKEDVMKVYVTNENVTTYENKEYNPKVRTINNKNKAYAETSLKAVAPTGVVTTTEISGYNEKNETITSVNEQASIGKLDVKKETKVANLTMNVINNYENIIKDVKILGRLPVEGSKRIETNNSLGSNFTANLISDITINNIEKEKYTIYYSKNDEATKDLSLAQNEWTTSKDNIDEAKSYLIVFNNYEMNTGDILEFKYSVSIPEQMEYNKATFTNYAVYFDNIKENEIIKDKQTSAIVGLSTGEGPNLEVSLTSDKERDVEEGQIITYTMSVKNIGSSEVKNVKLTGTIPSNTIYTTYEGKEGTEDPVTKVQISGMNEYTKIIEQIQQGETIEVSYMVEAKSLENEQEKTIQALATATVENYEGVFKSNQVTNKIVEGYLNINMQMQPSYENKKEGQEFSYVTTIQNVNMKQKENVVITDTLPNGISFISANLEGKYNKQTNTVTWDIGEIKALETKTITLKVKIDEMKQGQSLQSVVNQMNIKTSDKELKTNEVKFSIERPVLTVTQTSRTKEEILVGDTIDYNVTIKNVGETIARNVVVKDYMPEGIIYRGSTYIIDGKKQESWIGSKEAIISIGTIKPNETVDITIKAYVDDIEKNYTKRYITNIVGVQAENMKTIASNEVKHTIVKKAQISDPSVEEPIEGTYKITGLAWLDANSNGKRDDEEQPLKDIEVLLINSETGKIVIDEQTKKNKTQFTNELGEYTFENVKPGKYLVIFMYDTKNFNVTKYKQSGVLDSKNSDVISINAIINEETKLVAATDSIEITNNNIMNMDIGLVENKKFDLKLDKTVSKITINNKKGVKEYAYKDAKLAKIDLPKEEVEGTTIIVEYKIKVTNEGGVAGYVKKIVDYMPNDMKFNSELNKDWYEGESGNLYNSALTNILLNPGETKEVTLILTKVMNNNNTGTINNVAEIYEVSNDYGIKDIDSLPANKVQNEDDISLADVIIGVKTGEIYVYIVITLFSIILLGVGIYIIKKKVLTRI